MLHMLGVLSSTGSVPLIPKSFGLCARRQGLSRTNYWARLSCGSSGWLPLDYEAWGLILHSDIPQTSKCVNMMVSGPKSHGRHSNWGLL